MTDIYQFPYHQRPEGEIVEIDAHTYFSIPAKFTEGEKVWLVAARKTGPAIKSGKLFQDNGQIGPIDDNLDVSMAIIPIHPNEIVKVAKIIAQDI